LKICNNKKKNPVYAGVCKVEFRVLTDKPPADVGGTTRRIFYKIFFHMFIITDFC